MTYSSCLNSRNDNLVADTSVIINLNATGIAKQILEVLPNKVFVADAAALELNNDNKQGRRDLEHFEELIKTKSLKRISLSQNGNDTFAKLVTGSSSITLDDGEAATIAASVEYGYGMVMDERKARKLCENQFAHIIRASTIDILSQNDVMLKLGKDSVATAVFNALKNARMRVLEEQQEWVINLIGRVRAFECRSLPRHLGLDKK